MLNLKTTSSSKSKVNRVINEIVSKHPEYTAIAKYLCEFQGQIWASEIRKKTNLDTGSLLDAIQENSEYFGIKNVGYSSLEYQKATLQITDEILDYFDSILKDESFSDIEKELIDNLFYGKKANSTQYKLTSKIDLFFEKLFSKNYREFDVLLQKLDLFKITLDEDIEIVFHDIEILFKLSSLFRDFVPKTNEINKRDIYCLMSQAIDELEYYPFETEVKTVMQKSFERDNISTICNDLGKHHDYVERRYSLGLEALKWIFWGYTETDTENQ